MIVDLLIVVAVVGVGDVVCLDVGVDRTVVVGIAVAAVVAVDHTVAVAEAVDNSAVVPAVNFGLNIEMVFFVPHHHCFPIVDSVAVVAVMTKMLPIY